MHFNSIHLCSFQKSKNYTDFVTFRPIGTNLSTDANFQLSGGKFPEHPLAKIRGTIIVFHISQVPVVEAGLLHAF